MRTHLGFDATRENDDRELENPLNTGLATVDPSAPPPGTRFLYLPVVSR